MEGLAELHTHLGGSVSSDILWSLAHQQGIALPVKDYWDFDRLVTVSDPRGVPDLDALDAIYHWTELIQSSPAAVEVSVHGAIGGAYRSQGITTLELRFNPMKRNRGGERDLDHIILAAIRGLDVASLEYSQVRAGLILMMDRTFTPRQNEIIVGQCSPLLFDLAPQFRPVPFESLFIDHDFALIVNRPPFDPYGAARNFSESAEISRRNCLSCHVRRRPHCSETS